MSPNREVWDHVISCGFHRSGHCDGSDRLGIACGCDFIHHIFGRCSDPALPGMPSRPGSRKPRLRRKARPELGGGNGPVPRWHVLAQPKSQRHLLGPPRRGPMVSMQFCLGPIQPWARRRRAAFTASHPLGMKPIQLPSPRIVHCAGEPGGYPDRTDPDTSRRNLRSRAHPKWGSCRWSR
jgi:hypothetical protein